MKQNILFVDDSMLEYELFLEAAQLSGFKGTIMCINDPRNVFKYLDNLGRRPDLIIVDIRMPHVNGHALVKKLKSDPNYCDIFTVVFSSSDLAKDKEKAFKFGANYFFNKPDEFSRYPSLINGMLDMISEVRYAA